jgi:hypothetical protein
MNTARAVESFSDEHEAFAASRVSQYVFVPTKEAYFSVLDQYADTVEGDVKKPLVLVGNEGSGKSALLANWVAKRREHKHRDEFLFQHFVGCSAQSLQLAHTLSRLETALAKFFHFNRMKVPDTEVELRWSLNRFLEAASKKHSPARIVIIIDGVHNLKSEGSPDGALYWLPTELPKCVRFIISTVEHDRYQKGRKENSPHHTFVELVRRQCQIERIVPLSVTTCHSVINAFRNLYSQSFELTEAQQFKIVTANSSTQPMYLRIILQAIRLASTLTNSSADELLEKFLGCVNAHELVNLCMDICCQVPDRDEDDEQVLQDLLGKMMSMIYASRSGLTEVEIFGILRMVAGSDPTLDQKDRLLTIMKDCTMVVNDMYAFSHEVFREVVYNKYIHNRGALVRWHHYLARYFDQLPTCPRKLVALPYHLEMAGSWSKVKNCLTDIEMFELWRTSEFRADFMKFWASLIKKIPPGSKSELHDAGSTTNTASSFNSAIGAGGIASSRPSYDIVDEYCKSLDEWRHAKSPSDAKVRDIILQIATFLLDFAMLGHEVDAPALIHPKVPYEDLEGMGVPYIQIDESGNSVQRAPKRSCMTLSSDPENSPVANGSNNNNASNTLSMAGTGGQSALANEGADDEAFNDALGSKTMEDQTVTIYYYQRWMWIQFPFVALGNCDPQLFEKVTLDRNIRTSQSIDNNDDHKGGATMKRSETFGSLLSQSSTADEISKMVKRALSRSPVNQAASAELKLPAIQREMERERRLKEMKKRGHRAKRTIPRMPPPPPPKAKVRGMSATGTAGNSNGEGGDNNGQTTSGGNNDGNNGGGNGESNGESTDNNGATNKSMSASASGPMLAGIGSGDGNGKQLSQLEIRTLALQDSIQIAREEYDQLVQDRAVVERKLQTVKDQLVDLERTAESCTLYDDSLQIAVQREQESQLKLQRSQLWNKNLKNLVMMCDRHPANVPALITELQEKLELDGILVAEFRKRLWEQRFEQQTYFSTFRHMKNLVSDAVNMRDQILSMKEKLRDDLVNQTEEDERRILQSSASGSLMSRQKSAGGSVTAGPDDKGVAIRKDGRLSPSSSDKLKGLTPAEELQAYLQEKEREAGGEVPTSLLVQGFPSYEKAWEKMSTSTGITEPEAFCQRIENAEVLRQQIHQIKRASEQRLEMLRAEANEIEKELHEAENSAKTLSIASTKDHAKLLASKQQELKQKREDVEGKDALAHRALSGLAQISDLLCLPKSDEDAKINTIVSEIETALDTLLAEREKQQQQQQSTREGGSSSMPEIHASRSPELDLVLSKHEAPTVRLPKKLPSRPESDNDNSLKMKITSDIADQLHWNRAGKIDEDEDEEVDVNRKTWDRKSVKQASQTLVRTMMKSASRVDKDKDQKDIEPSGGSKYRK